MSMACLIRSKIVLPAAALVRGLSTNRQALLSRTDAQHSLSGKDDCWIFADPQKRAFSNYPTSQKWTEYHVQRAAPFESRVFRKEIVQMADRDEEIVRGGRHLFQLLPKAFEGIKQIGVIGWGAQGSAQAQNLRESLESTAIKVKVGLRGTHSSSWADAKSAGFTEDSGTLGEMYEVVKESDLNIVLISDGALTQIYDKLIKAIKPGSYFGLSHGFLLGHLNSIGKTFPPDLNVIAVCPKGVGISVRRLYEQGREVNGAGINASFAVHQDVSGCATDVALGWGIGIGSPFVFQTTLEAEYKSDIFGERGILCGAIHGISEVLFRHFIRLGISPHEAYNRTAEAITGPISKAISRGGLMAVYDAIPIDSREQFEKAYSVSYSPAMEILCEIYEDVASGREIASVVDHTRRFANFPLQTIDNTPMWRVGTQVRATRGSIDTAVLDPVTSGVYLAAMVAQCDLLIDAGHAYSEVANESIIEAVDSLNPYMKFRGISYLVDTCSVTARLGARKWAPRFDYLLEQQAISKIEENTASIDLDLIERFKAHKIHDIMKTCLSLRPSVDIVPHVTKLGESRSDQQ